MAFLIVNGEVVAQKEANLTHFLWNEPFILSQKTWFGYGGIPLLQENTDAIESQLNTFGLPLPDLFRNKRELFRLTKRMLNKNKFYRSGIINFRFFISGTKIDSVITSLAFPEFDFPFSPHGLLINFGSLAKNSHSPLSRFSYHSKALWDSAEAQNRNTQIHSSVLLNERGFICESIASNIFIIKENELLTPAIETGCYEDTIRPLVLSLSENLKLRTIESPKIKKTHLLSADEVFLASEEFGIRWVLGIEKRRFVHHYSKLICGELNAYLENKTIG